MSLIKTNSKRLAKPSYMSGFYSPEKGGVPAYPELWKGCVGAWSMGLGPVGAMLRDQSGNKRHGTMSGMELSDWVTSEGQYALDFDGSEQIVTTYVPSDFGGAKPITMCAWVKPDVLTGSRTVMTSDGAIFFRLGDGANSDISIILLGLSNDRYSRGDLTLGIWQHVAVSYNGSQFEIFLNGKSLGVSSTSGTYTTPTNVFNIGSRAGIENFDGMMDDVRLYNRALQLSEIKILARRRNIAYEHKRKFTYSIPLPITASGGIIRRRAAQPSYTQGFASPERGNMAHPELWNGCVGAWAPCLGPTGKVLRDNSGRNNHGTLTAMDPNTDWVSSGGKYALDFDGIDDGVPVNSSTKYLQTGSLSMSCWIYFPTAYTSGSGLYAIYRMGDDPSLNDVWIAMGDIYGSSDGKFHFDYINNVSGFSKYGTVKNSWLANTWYHVVATYSPQRITFYINGVQDSAVVPTAPRGGTPYAVLASIARSPSGTGRFLRASLDDFRIYNRELKPSEVKLLSVHRGIAYERARKITYSSPLPSTTNSILTSLRSKAKPSYSQGFASPERGNLAYPSLWQDCVGAWAPCLGPTGTTLRDQSGNKNHGTLTLMEPDTDWVVSGGRYALDCNGTDEHIEITGTNLNYFMGVQHYTMSIWAYVRETTTVDSPAIISIGRGFHRIEIVIRTNGTAIETKRDTTSVFVGYSYLNKWSHFAATFDGSQIKLYANGVLLGVSATSASLMSVSPENWKIGRASDAAYADCQVDDVRVYDRALLLNEIKLLATRRGIAYERTRKIFYSSNAPLSTTPSGGKIARKSLVKPSYTSGFATPERGGMAYPELWKGCVGAWAPLLGPTGLTLRDNSGRGNHGTLTNMEPDTDWEVSGGDYALKFVTNDEVKCGDVLLGLYNFSVAAWVNPNSTARMSYVSKANGASSTDFSFILESESSAWRAILRSGSNQIITSSISWAMGVWAHLCLTYNGNTINLFVNGVSVGTPVATTDPINVTTSSFAIGSRSGGSPTQFLDGLVDDVILYNRALTLNEIKLLSLRRGIAYERTRKIPTNNLIDTSVSRGYNTFRPAIIRVTR